MSKETKRKEEWGTEDFAMAFGALVYIGAIIVATVFFISYIIGVVDETRYGTIAAMTLGGILVGGSSIAFPVSLHTWINERRHRILTQILYAGDIVFVALNVIVSYNVLGAIEKGLTIPLWMQSYEHYSVISIAYVAMAWALIFATNPAYKIKRDEKEAKQRIKDERRKLQEERDRRELETERAIFEKEQEFYGSIEGEEHIAELAQARISSVLKKRRNSESRAPYHYGKNRAMPAMATDTERVKLPNA